MKTISTQIFKGCLPQILFGPLLNILAQISQVVFIKLCCVFYICEYLWMILTLDILDVAALLTSVLFVKNYF